MPEYDYSTNVEVNVEVGLRMAQMTLASFIGLSEKHLVSEDFHRLAHQADMELMEPLVRCLYGESDHPSPQEMWVKVNAHITEMLEALQRMEEIAREGL